MRVRTTLAVLSTLCACGGADDGRAPGRAPPFQQPPRTAPRCTLDDGPAPLLDVALAAAELTRDTFGFSAADLAEADYLPVLGDDFLLPWFEELRGHPLRAGCFEGEAVWPLDSAMLGAHPASQAIGEAARLLDRVAPVLPAAGSDLEEAIAALCEGPAGPCSGRSGEVPADLAPRLAPVIHAIAEGVGARRALEGTGIAPDFWYTQAGLMLWGFNFDLAQLQNGEVMAGYLGRDRDRLYAAAQAIAAAVEDADLGGFAGRTGVSFDLTTAAGAIQLRGAEAHTFTDEVDVLLRVDLGGDDTYLDGAGSNRSAANPVSVVVDVAGNDTYGYVEGGGLSQIPGLLPADGAGRYAGTSDDECRSSGSCYGPISLSTTSRQGSARFGIAFLFDLAGDDVYRSLRASQGYGQLGVGILLDAGGNDRYHAEAQSQGAAQFGIGIAIDLGGGDDMRRSITESQGFGYVGGVGLLLDDGGNDIYYCDHGDPARGGRRMYASPQTGVTGNSSFCQGAGFGARLDSQQVFLSGGLGILRDVAGGDRYTASVFAQGTGYWQGTGLLSDGGGADVYQADWYVQGAAAHYAVGMLIDDGEGDDVFDEDRPPYNMSLGSGHDYSVGVLVNEAGDDVYHVTTLAVGSSNCNGVGLFVDGRGDDRYLATSDTNMGMGNVSSECSASRPGARSMGIMIDAGGDDTYESPETTFPRPANGARWTYVRSDHPGERGGGVDGSGESGIHAGSTR